MEMSCIRLVTVAAGGNRKAVEAFNCLKGSRAMPNGSRNHGVRYKIDIDRYCIIHRKIIWCSTIELN